MKDFQELKRIFAQFL